MKLLLIDGDILAYVNCAKHEVAEETQDGYWTWKCKARDVKDSMHGIIDFWMDRLGADNYLICMSDDNTNFRKSVDPNYKMFRQKYKRPVALKGIKEYLLSLNEAVLIPQLEADDVMGILSTNPQRDYEPIIISMDKDMKCIPGLLFRTEEEGIIEISEQEADYNHLLQTLTGDPTDGYSGCPGIGAVGAKKLLDKSPTWDTVRNTYISKGLTEEDALRNARLARILRDSDYDFENKRPKLWLP